MIIAWESAVLFEYTHACVYVWNPLRRLKSFKDLFTNKLTPWVRVSQIIWEFEENGKYYWWPVDIYCGIYSAPCFWQVPKHCPVSILKERVWKRMWQACMVYCGFMVANNDVNAFSFRFGKILWTKWACIGNTTISRCPNFNKLFSVPSKWTLCSWTVISQ